jgi:anti-anti-sigma factor
VQQTFQTPHLTPGSALSCPGGLSFIIDHRGRQARLAVAGELDVATVDQLTQVATGALRLPVDVFVLDFGAVSFCGAAGVGALIKIHRIARQAAISLVLIRVQPRVRHVLDIVGVSVVIPIGRASETRCCNGDGATIPPPSTAADDTEREHWRSLKAA